MRRREGTLQRLLLRMVVVAAMGGALFAVGVAYFVSQSRAQTAARELISELVLAISRTASIGVYTRDAVLLAEVTRGLAAHPLVASVQVRSLEGELLQHHGAEHEAPTEGWSASARGQRLAYELPSPFKDREIVGTLHIVVESDGVAALAGGQAQTLGVALVVQTLLLAAVLYWGVAKVVSQPIIQFARVLRTMLPGTANRVLPPPIHATDEIGLLTAAANALLQANEDALRRERQLRSNLEAVELRHANVLGATGIGIFGVTVSGRIVHANAAFWRLLESADDIASGSNDEGVSFERLFNEPEVLRSLLDVARTCSDPVCADVATKQCRWRMHVCLCARGGERGSAVDALIDGVVYRLSGECR